ncbi:MAG: hypothetical protein M3R20_04855, partial [Pseudomonadota bacterium]|nr:hypothetical protein [Pseudomonadota bacterium]
ASRSVMHLSLETNSPKPSRALRFSRQAGRRELALGRLRIQLRRPTPVHPWTARSPVRDGIQVIAHYSGSPLCSNMRALLPLAAAMLGIAYSAVARSMTAILGLRSCAMCVGAL